MSQKRVALDATSNGTEAFIAVSGTDNDQLTLTYGGAAVGGPRVYLIEEDGVNKNTMFMLRGKEFTFEVELSTMQCGFNAALYFVGMNENDGGAESGTKYCDAQAVGGTFCSEMDLFEANTQAQQYTTHACVDACGSYTEDVPQCKGNGSPSTVCDQSGCGLNPFRYGEGTSYYNENNNWNWHGFGSGHAIDSNKPFTVVTQFHDTNISRFYVQSGNRVDLPTLYVTPPTDGSHYGAFESPAIREDFCVDIYDRWTGGSATKPLAQMFNNMENGMVLAMSAWYDQETYVNGQPVQGETQTGMSWLDGVNYWGEHYTKAGPCTETTTDAGNHYATFSDIRFGDIGTTLAPLPPTPPPAPTPPAPTPPAPTPPAPSPSPGGQCHQLDGSFDGAACGYNCDDDCNCGHCNSMPGCMSEDQCMGNCNSGNNAKWCPGGVTPTPPAPTPAPTPPPTPVPTPPAPSPSPGGTCHQLDGTFDGAACGYNCDDDCNCGRCNTKPGCMSEGQCMGNCNGGNNAKWCGIVMDSVV